MKVVYVSCLCSENKYKQLFDKIKVKPGQQIQKYHRLMVEGLSQNKNIQVEVITALPINKQNSSRLIINEKKEITEGVSYIYLPIINIKVIKNVFVFFSSFFTSFCRLLKDKESVIICDVLNVSVSAGALLSSKILRRNSVGIVTDIPQYVSNNKKRGIIKINDYIIRRFKSYVFLTEDMNSLINSNGKPYVVIEGQVDINMKDIENVIEEKYDKKICIYAGGLQRKYGIQYLCEGFIKANVNNSELHIYGNGEYSDELKSIVKEHGNIKYHGVVLNKKVVEEQMKATLLVNPRPTRDEYTKYSFPSKNMEYMVSGTPILTTNLPGMPREYNDYVYIIKDESADGICEDFRKILSTNRQVLHDKGNKAKKFVLEHKNNVVQAKKIINMIIRNNGGDLNDGL